MKSRRDFIKISGIAGLGIAGNNIFKDLQSADLPDPYVNVIPASKSMLKSDFTPNLIGPYGPWAAGLTENNLPLLSFRRKEWTDIGKWRSAARKRLAERLAIPDIGGIPQVIKVKEYNYDGLHIEELKWQLSYGRPTEAILLKPQNATGKLPAIMAFHDHGGNKYFGTRKITKTSDEQHPMMVTHQQDYYEGRAWANEIAKRGYVVLVSDAFPFASRRGHGRH